MRLQRNEILTGLLVLATIAVLTAILILLGAPGLFRPLVTYRIYMDNAAGIKLGAPVLPRGGGTSLAEMFKAGRPVYGSSSGLVAEGALVSNGPDLVSIGEQVGERPIVLVVPDGVAAPGLWWWRSKNIIIVGTNVREMA